MSLIEKICNKLEAMSVNHINWIKTLYFNIRCLPLAQAIKLPIYLYGRPMLINLSGQIQIAGKITRGMITINKMNPFAPSYQNLNTQIIICGKITFRGAYFIGTGNKILVNKGAHLDLGANGVISDMINVVCYTSITIGEGTRIAHRSQLIDTNNHFILNTTYHTSKKNTAPISIGKYCWICNSTTVTQGCIIPNQTIIGSNSLVNKDFSTVPEMSLIGGIPAKHLSTGYVRIFNHSIEEEINKFFTDNSEAKEYIMDNDEINNVCL